MFLPILFLLGISRNLIRANYYMASSGMKELVTLETELATSFLEYYRQEMVRINELETFLECYPLKNNQSDREALRTKQSEREEEQMSSNPTSAYKLVKRFTTRWKNFDQFHRPEFPSSIHNALLDKVVGFEDDTEMRGSVHAIIKLQETYIINVTDFVDGYNKHSQKLPLRDVFIIGYYAMLMDYHHIAQIWLEESYHRYYNMKENSLYPYTFINLLEGLIWTCYNSGDLEKAVYYTEKQLELQPNSQKLMDHLTWYRNETKFIQPGNTKKNLTTIGDVTNRPWLTRLNKMCRGEEEMKQKAKNRLYCSYYSPAYRFYLKPMMLEIAYDDPYILVFHNLLSNEEVVNLIAKSRVELKVAEVFSINAGKMMPVDYRMSKSAWFTQWDDLLTYNIYRRVGDLVNLNMVYSEPLQVANYGIGGSYESHYDHATPPYNSSIFGAYNWGNRMATMLVYLSNVGEGGDTVFVNTGPGVVVSPKKGAGVYWLNLKENGQSDPKTKHAGCPVLVGEKWVANIWIHEHGQEFLRPCSLDPKL